MIREEGLFKIKKKPLWEFCEALAVDIYQKREQRGMEKIPRAEIKVLAEKWKIAVDDWKLSGRSLLNRDALGNYKFAHRSIMEYLFIKRVLNNSQAFSKKGKILWSDQMKKFIREMLDSYRFSGEEIPSDLSRIDIDILHQMLRYEPVKELQEEAVRKMLQLYCFYEKNRNPKGEGVYHDYQVIEKTRKKAEKKIVLDRTTNLMWQQAGSSEPMIHKEVKKYIQKLNQKKFAGYSDWRLPTLEEAMSLMEPKQKNGDLYIDPLFDRTQSWIWTCDPYSASSFWSVNFYLGNCSSSTDLDLHNCVRAVRFEQ